MLTSLPPAEGVSETELITTAKERIEVLGGGVNGSAASVRFSEPLLPTVQLVVQTFFTPLQDESERTAASTARTRHFLGFMQTPHDGFDRQPWRKRQLEFPNNTLLYSLPRNAQKT